MCAVLIYSENMCRHMFDHAHMYVRACTRLCSVQALMPMHAYAFIPHAFAYLSIHMRVHAHMHMRRHAGFGHACPYIQHGACRHARVHAWAWMCAKAKIHMPAQNRLRAHDVYMWAQRRFCAYTSMWRRHAYASVGTCGHMRVQTCA